MTQNISKIKWKHADFLWNNNPYTWDEVQLITEITRGDTSGHGVKKIVDELDYEKKNKLIHLIMRRKGIKVYDKRKEVKSVDINIKDVELIIKEVKAQIIAENIHV